MTEEALKLKTGKESGEDGLTKTCSILGFWKLKNACSIYLTSALRSLMYPELESYHILNYFTKAKEAKQPSSYTGINLFCCMYRLFTGNNQPLRTWVKRKIFFSTTFQFNCFSSINLRTGEVTYVDEFLKSK